MKMTTPARRAILMIGLGLGTLAPAAFADDPKVPVLNDDKGSVYIQPKVAPTDTTVHSEGATVGVQRKDGSATYGGVDTSGTRPTYSLGASTGGNVSYSAGAHSDGKDNKGVKAGITIKY